MARARSVYETLGVAKARERCLDIVLRHLGGTEVGRVFGLARMGTLADFRAAVPLMSPEVHAREVEARIGFGATDATDPRAAELSGSEFERHRVAAVWRAWLGDGDVTNERALVLAARYHDPVIDRMREHDLRELGAEVRRFDSLARDRDVGDLLALIESYRPTILAVPTTHTCAWLEQILRGPLERRIPSLRLVLASFDLAKRVRTGVPVEFAGWVHRSGRLGLPTPRAPGRAFTLATGSQIVELLPHTKFDHRSGRPIAQTETVLPEHAIVGERYELVVSSALGFLRLRTDDHVRVIGFEAPADYEPPGPPRPRVVRLPSPPMDVALEGVSLVGTWLTASVRQAFKPEDPALVAATIGPDPSSIGGPGKPTTGTGRRRVPQAGESATFDPFVDTELGDVRGSDRGARPKPRPRRLLVQVEAQGEARGGFETRLARSVDRDLCRRSPAYAHLRGRGELEPPVVVSVESGSFRNAQLRRIRSLRGRVDFPVVRVVGHARASIFPATSQGRHG